MVKRRIIIEIDVATITSTCSCSKISNFSKSITKRVCSKSILFSWKVIAVICPNCGIDLKKYLKAKKPFVFGFRKNDEAWVYAYCRCGRKVLEKKIDKEKAFEYMRKMSEVK